MELHLLFFLGLTHCVALRLGTAGGVECLIIYASRECAFVGPAFEAIFFFVGKWIPSLPEVFDETLHFTLVDGLGDLAIAVDGCS